MKLKDKVSISLIILSLAGLTCLYSHYQINECINTKTLAINKITDSYNEITSPVLKNRIDKQYNVKVNELKALKSTTIIKQIKICNK